MIVALCNCQNEKAVCFKDNSREEYIEKHVAHALWLYGKEGVLFEGLLRLAYGEPSKKKIKNFKVTKNKVGIKISTHLR